MKARRSVLGLIGVVVVLALIVPTVGAGHNAVVANVWNDAGSNPGPTQADGPIWSDAGLDTRSAQTDALVWNDAALQPWLAQVKTVGWNDVALRTRPTPDNTVGWNDAGTNAGRLWFHAAAKG